MATVAQTAANQANAQFSTGPKTEAGKAASARNSFQHGFRSQSVLLPGDDPAEFAALCDELAEHFNPEDLTEDRYVREMANAEWRLRRTRGYIHSALSRKIAELASQHPGLDPLDLQALAFEALHAPGSPFPQYLRYESKYERQFDRAYRGWASYQEAQDKRCQREFEAALMAPPPWPRREPVHSPAPAPAPASETAPTQNRTNEPNSPPPTPRNHPCPCGSGLKFKRCCGKDAPATLFPDALAHSKSRDNGHERAASSALRPVS